MKRFMVISILGLWCTPALCVYPYSGGDRKRYSENQGSAAMSKASPGISAELKEAIYDPFVSTIQMEDLLHRELNALVSLPSVPSSTGAAATGGAGGLRGDASLVEDSAGGLIGPKLPVRRVPPPSIDECISTVKAAVESAELELGLKVSSTSEAPTEVLSTANPSASTTL